MTTTPRKAPNFRAKTQHATFAGCRSSVLVDGLIHIEGYLHSTGAKVLVDFTNPYTFDDDAKAQLDKMQNLRDTLDREIFRLSALIANARRDELDRAKAFITEMDATARKMEAEPGTSYTMGPGHFNEVVSVMMAMLNELTRWQSRADAAKRSAELAVDHLNGMWG